MKRQQLAVLLSMFCFLLHAQFQPSYYMIGGNTLPYQVLLPENYDETKQYPLVVFLHGAGERGSDNEKQLIHGKDFFINNFQSEYPAIVIAPQCPEATYWSNVQSHTIVGKREFNFDVMDKPTLAMETLTYLINDWIQSGRINTNQVYVGGLSMGGMGTYELLYRMPNTFAAAFAICGGGNVNKIKTNLGNTALWIFHGIDDSVVPIELSKNIYQSLLSDGKEVKMTEYPGVNHNSWDSAFHNKELAPWLLKHKRLSN